jgi:predicted DNA-binding protein
LSVGNQSAMILCMRITLRLTDDLAARVERLQREANATSAQIVNEALRLGLEGMIRPAIAATAFRTHSVDLGKCYFPNLDKTWEVLAEAEWSNPLKP